MEPNNTEIAHQLGAITTRLDLLVKSLEALKGDVHGLSVKHADLSARTTFLTSILGGVAALVGSHVLSLVMG